MEIQQLHSHSGLEREMNLSKSFVLIDASFVGMFYAQGIETTTLRYHGKEYHKVAVMDFVRLGGVFKNYNQ